MAFSLNQKSIFLKLGFLISLSFIFSNLSNKAKYSFVNFWGLIGVVFALARKIANGFKINAIGISAKILLSTRAVPEPQKISQIVSPSLLYVSNNLRATCGMNIAG